MEKGKIIRAGKNEGKVVKKKKIRRVSSNYSCNAWMNTVVSITTASTVPLLPHYKVRNTKYEMYLY